MRRSTHLTVQPPMNSLATYHELYAIIRIFAHIYCRINACPFAAHVSSWPHLRSPRMFAQWQHVRSLRMEDIALLHVRRLRMHAVAGGGTWSPVANHAQNLLTDHLAAVQAVPRTAAACTAHALRARCDLGISRSASGLRP
jgi:hypothetical protein